MFSPLPDMHACSLLVLLLLSLLHLLHSLSSLPRAQPLLLTCFLGWGLSMVCVVLPC
jgi:hypothetical protein